MINFTPILKQKPKQKPKCSNCIYFRSFGNELGECRRNAPIIVTREGDFVTTWPTLADWEWCGEFKK